MGYITPLRGSASALTTDTSRRPSENVWKKCPWDKIAGEPGYHGMCMFDDFLHVPGPTPTITTTIAVVGGWTMFGSANSTVTADGAIGGGVQLLTSDDNGATSLIWGGQAPYRITAGGTVGSLWYEARIKCSTITTTEQSFAIGLMDYVTPTATVPLVAAAGELAATMNFVGFHKLDTDTTTFDGLYVADGVTKVATNEGIGTLVVDTYVKLGMFFDSTTALLHWYINGAEQASTKTIPSDTGTDFPADVGLTPVLAVGAGTADDESVTVDWVKCAQLFAVE